MKPEFLAAPWNHPFNNEGWWVFKVGACHGQWRCTDTAYEILAVISDVPGNGDFNTTLEYFYASCERDKRDLVIRQVWNKKLKKHLIEKRGFGLLSKDDLIKKFT